MKRTLALACLCFAFWTRPEDGAAQTVGVQPVGELQRSTVRDSALINALNNFTLLAEVGTPTARANLAVRVLEVSGESGSAKDGESDQVVSWLYIAVSEFGEAPTQRLFRLGPVFDPKLDSLRTKGDSAVVFVSYGASAKRQHARIAATLDGIRVTAVRVGKG